MRDFNRVIRYLAYTLELLVLFMLQETPGLLPPIYGVRPVLLLPAVVAIALFEEEIPAMAFGILGGLFCDFGLGCGLLTFFIRYFGGYPEGVSYAILLMNICTPIIEKYTRPSRFGVTKEDRKAAKAAKKGGAKA